MDRTFAPNYTVVAGKRVYQDRDKPNGVPGTSLLAEDRTKVEEELIGGLIEAAGLTPDRADLRQINTALRIMYSAYERGVAPWDLSVAQRIGGYPLNAMVCDPASPGVFWVSTEDRNTTIPGADGAAWQSLFNGYATQAQADDRYVQQCSGDQDYSPLQAGVNKTSGNIWLSYNDGGTVKWAFAQKAGSYIISPYNPETDARIVALSRNKTNGGIFVVYEDGTNAQLQPAGNYAPAGDYATNATANGKISKNTSQGPSVDSMGIVSASGQPFCVDSAGKLRYVVKSPGASTTDVPVQSVGINNQRIYVSYDNDTKAAWLVRSPAEGSTDTRVGAIGINGSAPYLAYGGANDASNPMWLAKASDLPTSGTLPGGTYTKIGSVLQQHFTVSGVSHVDNGFWVSFPIAYSQTPQTIQLTSNTSGDMDVNWFNASPTGFYIMVPYDSTSQNQPVSVLVDGIA